MGDWLRHQLCSRFRSSFDVEHCRLPQRGMECRRILFLDPNRGPFLWHHLRRFPIWFVHLYGPGKPREYTVAGIQIPSQWRVLETEEGPREIRSLKFYRSWQALQNIGIRKRNQKNANYRTRGLRRVCGVRTVAEVVHRSWRWRWTNVYNMVGGVTAARWRLTASSEHFNMTILLFVHLLPSHCFQFFISARSHTKKMV